MADPTAVLYPQLPTMPATGAALRETIKQVKGLEFYGATPPPGPGMATAPVVVAGMAASAPAPAPLHTTRHVRSLEIARLPRH